jgi:hypothetical protein
MSTVNITTNSAGTNTYQLAPVGGGTPITGAITSSTFSTSVPSGSYNLQITNPSTGEVLHNSTIDATSSTSVYAQATSQQDTSTVGVSPTPISSGQFQSQAHAVQPQILVPPTDAEVFTAANGQFGKYFTCQDARLYIGNVFIDENIFVQYTLQDNKIPIYGYRSRYYDATAQGKSIVQGQLGLNFVSEGYLYTVLQAYQNLVLSDPGGDQTTLNNLVYTLNQLQTQQQGLPTTGAGATVASNQSQITVVKAAITKSLSNSNVSLSTAQNYATNAVSIFPDITEGFSNALYQDIAFDLVVQLEGAGRTVKRVLENCQLIANDQVIDTSGNTLSDGYSFIARRLR